MKILIAYATTEGHTRRIVRHVADTAMDHGHSVELLALKDAEDLDLGRFDRAILAASVHANHYQRSLPDFVAGALGPLTEMPTMFLSVSLSAAGHDAEDWRGLEGIAEDFVAATGWLPGHVAHIAGAYLPSRYDVVRRLIMRRIMSAKDPEADLHADKVYTDWAALTRLTEDWLADPDRRHGQT